TEVSSTVFPPDVPSDGAPIGPSTVSPGSTTVPTISSVPAAVTIVIDIPIGRVNVPAGRYVVPTGKNNLIVSTGRKKVIPAGRTILVLIVLSELIV
ncbi:hypothetical protein Tco_0080869, partial [Tanacetum coccineum]